MPGVDTLSFWSEKLPFDLSKVLETYMGIGKRRYSMPNTRLIRTRACFVTPFQADLTSRVTYDYIEFENSPV